MNNLGYNILCYVRGNKRLFNLKNNNKKKIKYKLI